jgi:PAS domain S-box-containing protein
MDEKPTFQEQEKQIHQLEKTEARLKKIEQALRESENRYRAVVEDMPALTCGFLPSGEIIFVNKVYCDYFNKSFEELVGSNFLRLIPESEQKAVLDNISALTVESPTMSQEHLVNAPKGDTRWQRWTNRALFDDRGQVIGYQSVGEDITEQKMYQEALRERVKELNCLYGISHLVESENKLSKILQGTVDLIPGSWQYPDITMSQIRLGSRVYRTHRHCERSCKKCPNQSMSRKIFVHDQPLGDIQVCYMAGKPKAREGPFLQEEQDLINAIAERLGRIIERKQADDEIKLLKEKYEDLYNNAPTMYLSVDANKIIVECNNTILNKLGYAKDEFIGKSLEIFLTEESVVSMQKDFPELLNTGKISGFDRQLITGSGEIIDVILSATMEYDEHHKPIKTRATFEDITERKQAEDLVHNLSQMLLKSQEHERMMLSGDLQDGIAQNLTSLKIDSDTFLDNQPAISNELKRKIENHSKMIELSIQIVRDLSDGLHPPGLDEVGIVPTISQYCEDFSDKTGLRINFTSSGMRGLKLDHNIMINLYRLVQEGLSNVRKHADAGSVSVKLIAAHPQIILRIEDDGKGFDVRTQMRALDSDKRIGIRSMRERVKLLKGKMDIQSRSMQGAKVIITFPII